MALGPPPSPYELSDPPVLLLDEPVLLVDDSEPLPAANTEADIDKKQNMNKKRLRIKTAFLRLKNYDGSKPDLDFTTPVNKFSVLKSTCARDFLSITITKIVALSPRLRCDGQRYCCSCGAHGGSPSNVTKILYRAHIGCEG